MRYLSYTGTRAQSKLDFDETVRSGDRIAVMVVASIWENEHGKFWAAYLGDGEGDKSLRSEITNTGRKLSRKLAEQLYPQIVNAGYEWWD